MTPLLTLLGLYYLCDQAAAHRGLAPGEVARCMAHYEALKLEFIPEEPARPGSAERAAQIRRGYAGFKQWEAANAALVADLRAQARDRLGISPG